MCTLGPGAGPGSLPAGGWPERPVWFALPAPLAACLSPQPLSRQPGWCLIWVLSPPRMTLHGLKRQAQGAEEDSYHCWLERPSSCALHPWLGWPVPPAVWKTRPMKSAQPGWVILRGAEWVGSWNRPSASLWLSFKHVKSLWSFLTKWDMKSKQQSIITESPLCA